METIYFNLDNLPKFDKKIVLCLGYFDGVHIGHQKLIKEALKTKLDVGVLTFDMPPHLITKKVNYDKQITSLDDKEKILEDLGVKFLFVMHFSNKEMNLNKDCFIKEVLMKLNPCQIICGEDYRFGHNGEGTPEYLSNFFKVFISKTLCIDENKVSSKDIGRFILEGNIDTVNALLNRKYQIKGTVIKGLSNGHKIGYPTANISCISSYYIPKCGVYIGYVQIEGKIYKSIINIGTHPTIDKLNSSVIEAHILDFDNDIYGKQIYIKFVKRIRDEKKFDSIDDLKLQILKDENLAKKILL